MVTTRSRGKRKLEHDNNEEKEQPPKKKQRRQKKATPGSGSNNNKRGKKSSKQSEEQLGATESINPTTTTMVTESNAPVIMEKGQVYFFYRPKVNLHTVKDLDDVQRFYIILRPTTHSEGSMLRLLYIGKKKLPDVGSHQKFWGQVEKVSTNMDDIRNLLRGYAYETKEHERHSVEIARPLAEGCYVLIEHHKNAHLAYVLELPEEPHEAQHVFNVNKEGSFVLSIKNPEAESTSDLVPNRSEADKPKYTEEQMEEFEGKRWQKPHLDLLNKDHAEVLLIGASGDLKQELGIYGEELEREAKESKETTKTFMKDLHMSLKNVHTESLVQGTLA